LDKSKIIRPVYEEVDGVQKLKRDETGEIVMETIINENLADGIADTDFPTTIPAEDRTYKAVWIQGDTSYTITYWLQNADNDSYSYISSTVIDPALSGTILTLSGLTDAQKEFPLSDTEDKIENYVELDTAAIEAQYEDHPVGTGTQKGVIVEGDGSTSFNVYFKRKEYTLKFYYAATISGKYYVIGGSSYHFGNLAPDSIDRYDEVKLLHNNFVTNYSQRGAVDNLPTLNQKGTDLINNGTYSYISSEDSNTGNVYHGIQLNARYGQDISEIWPVDIFKELKSPNGGYTDGNGNRIAYAAGWNGEYGVWYNHDGSVNGNYTIKGKYSKLDYKILFLDETKCNDSTVSYICFWENGANIGWSIPRLWRYKIYIPALPGENVDDVYKGVNYKCIDTYDTCDDNQANKPESQTQPALEGYNAVGRSEAKDIDTPTGYQDAYEIGFYYAPLDDTYLIFKTAENEELSSEYVSYKTELIGIGPDGYFFVPGYPNNLEANSYVFEGWYTSPDCVPATKFWDAEGNYVGGESYDVKIEGDGENAVYTPTMPASNLTLYQNWVPKTYTVEFYWNYKDVINPDATARVREAITVTHNERLIGTTIDNPSYEVADGEYRNPYYVPIEDDNLFSFAGWFYLDGDKRVAFDPNEMVFTQNLKLFAEWKTKITTSYTVRYLKAATDAAGKLLVDGNGDYYPELDSEGNPIELAEPTTGYIFTGTTKTFTAKAGDDLAAEPGGGMWLPQTGSHSILMDRTPANNTFDFLYVSKQAIGYTVEYRYADSGALIADLDQIETDGKTGQDKYQTKDAVISVLPQYLKDYTSSPPFVTMVMSLDETQNIVTFYYTKNTETEPGEGGNGEVIVQKNHYIVHYLLQDLDDPFSFTEQETLTGTEKFGYEVKQSDYNVKTFTGFEWKASFIVNENGEEKTFTSGFGTKEEDGEITISSTAQSEEVDKDIVELWLFYERKSYPYVVKYLETGTNKVVKTSVTGTAKYQSTLSQNGPPITGYDLISTATQTKNIGVEELTDNDYDKLERNVIRFYYQQKQVVVNYTSVCRGENPVPDMTGWLSRSVERPTSYLDADGKVQGSEPKQVPDGYRFMGWYTDSGCTVPATSAWISGSKLTPKLEEQVKNGVFEFNYYALFVPITLTITQTSDSGTTMGNDSGIYQVVSENGSVLTTVMLTGSESVTVRRVPAGKYTVRELSGNWTWTYEGVEAQSADLTTANGATVTFIRVAREPDWLHGENHGETPINKTN